MHTYGRSVGRAAAVSRLDAILPVLRSFRAWFLYLRVPYDRSSIAKYSDWQYVLAYLVAASPNAALRGAFFTAYLACVLVDREEHQLMSFVVALKGKTTLRPQPAACSRRSFVELPWS